MQYVSGAIAQILKELCNDGTKTNDTSYVRLNTPHFGDKSTWAWWHYQGRATPTFRKNYTFEKK